MTIQLHKDSHLDHVANLRTDEVDELLSWADARIPAADGVVVVTLDDAPHRLLVNLTGPAVGDPPVDESDVVYRPRGDRPWPSRIHRHDKITSFIRPTSTVTLVVGPHDGMQRVLYTVYGGPAAPREPSDPAISSPEELQVSQRFWSEHALHPY